MANGGMSKWHDVIVNNIILMAILDNRLDTMASNNIHQ